MYWGFKESESVRVIVSKMTCHYYRRIYAGTTSWPTRVRGLAALDSRFYLVKVAGKQTIDGGARYGIANDVA